MHVWSHSALPRLTAVFAGVAGALLFFAAAAATTPVPTTPPPSATPPPAGTPWPPPTGLKLEGHTVLLDANNFPLPPDKQQHFRGVSWDVLHGFTGTYEVQRAASPIRPAAGASLSWQTVAADIPATAAVDGRLEYVSQVPASENLMVHCFRVRTIIGSVSGPETGPFSDPICTPQPPTSGPGPGQTVVPLPPVVGNTPLTTEETGWLAAATLCSGALLLVLSTWALRVRESRGSPRRPPQEC
jgi:hypothetical protein